MSEFVLSARQLASLPEILIPKLREVGIALGSIDLTASEALINGAILRISQLEAAVAALIDAYDAARALQEKCGFDIAEEAVRDVK